jgi:hypothetical protein
MLPPPRGVEGSTRLRCRRNNRPGASLDSHAPISLPPPPLPRARSSAYRGRPTHRHTGANEVLLGPSARLPASTPRSSRASRPTALPIAHHHNAVLRACSSASSPRFDFARRLSVSSRRPPNICHRRSLRSSNAYWGGSVRAQRSETSRVCRETLALAIRDTRRQYTLQLIPIRISRLLSLRVGAFHFGHRLCFPLCAPPLLTPWIGILLTPPSYSYWQP